ncbi:bifunctional alpha/beta hydrolase/class I SAM-dependent methyltransferase [Serratia microhaemolytica]|uniref:bifunctional alpha/beta hydrolase/class I SAM-dependent methyltransferase n=1 Tax=Serratia microhaemolytica TaxID=2675110 RepID=UPI000FDE3EB5|nr:bifunctional alpha/beta hydrolase/class I SAM-dependent methyltransferase [Serratia microhaemolytica]
MNNQSINWFERETNFRSHDGTYLFYRVWQPRQFHQGTGARVIVFLHRGHEHSGRIAPLLAQLCRPVDWGFAYDARGHGYSPGQRGDAPDVACLVADLDTFVNHLCEQYGFTSSDILVVANSVGAVVAATWLHDYAPRIRGVIMAAAAFHIKLYVPLAKPALRVMSTFKPNLFVSSYIRSSMLTHSVQQAEAYDADPLITKAISANILLDLADTAERIVSDASAIDTPILMLVASEDYVVSEKPQWSFFERLSSRLKRYVKLPACRHAVFYEQNTDMAFSESRYFIDQCFANPITEPERYLLADQQSASAEAYRLLQQPHTGSLWLRAWFALQRKMLRHFGHLSDGMQIGLTYGFDSGESLDYVYRNQAGGRWGIGKLLDRGYLDAVGWQGIRVRKLQLQQMLAQRIATYQGQQPFRILDIAAGSGRYLLETLKRFQHQEIEVTLCDVSQFNLDQARTLAERLGLRATIRYVQRDAFDPASYQGEEGNYHLAIISGLYELFSDNQKVLCSLRGVSASLRADGMLLYTAQPWHPQLHTIAHTLINHQGEAWKMRPRPQCEMDALVVLSGCRKLMTNIGLQGIFTVSLAEKLPVPHVDG